MPFGLRGMLIELLQAHPQSAGHVFQKAPGSGGAAIVHLEPRRAAIRSDHDHFAILPASVEHGLGIGIQVMRADGKVE